MRLDVSREVHEVLLLRNLSSIPKKMWKTVLTFKQKNDVKRGVVLENIVLA